MATASACCLAAFRFGLLGQSILATVETQAARNSRGAGGGVLLSAWTVGTAADGALGPARCCRQAARTVAGATGQHTGDGQRQGAAFVIELHVNS